jgi:hypothetical protein
MTLPSMRSELVSREFLRVAGGYESEAEGDSPAGGLDVDNGGRLATDGDVTVKGILSAGDTPQALTNVNGEIDGARIQAGSVDTGQLADDAVDASKLDAAGDYAVNTLSTAGDATIGGDVDVQGGDIKNTEGNLSLDAQNAAADSTIYLKNSDATYEANVDVEGKLSVGGDLDVGGDIVSGADLAITPAGGDLCLNANVGIGTTTPSKKLTIHGTGGSLEGPHLDFVSSAQTQPLMQILAWQSDDISLRMGCYFDGAQRSSDAGSNFVMAKYQDKINWWYDSGVNVGDTVTWNTGLSMDLTDGTVEITGDVEMVGSFFPRQVNDSLMNSTSGTKGEMVFNLYDNKFYGCTATGSPATWATFH